MSDIREAVARAMHKADGRYRPWDDMFKSTQDRFLSYADAALSVARPLIEAEARRKVLSEVLDLVPLGQTDLFNALHDRLVATSGSAPEGEAERFIQAAIDTAPEPLRRLGKWLAKVLNEDQWSTAERMLLGAAVECDALDGALRKVSSLAAKANARISLIEAEARERIAAEAMDEGADFVLDTLHKALGEPEFVVCDGTEEWEGDVAGTVYNLLQSAGVIDEETGELATAKLKRVEAEARERALREAVAVCMPTDRSLYDSEMRAYGDHFAGMIYALLPAPAEEAKPATSDDGWIPWGGGECPVAPNDVSIRRRNGRVETGLPHIFNWAHDGHDFDIVAYRDVEADRD